MALRCHLVKKSLKGRRLFTERKFPTVSELLTAAFGVLS